MYPRKQGIGLAAAMAAEAAKFSVFVALCIGLAIANVCVLVAVGDNPVLMFAMLVLFAIDAAAAKALANRFHEFTEKVVSL